MSIHVNSDTRGIVQGLTGLSLGGAAAFRLSLKYHTFTHNLCKRR